MQQIPRRQAATYAKLDALEAEVAEQRQLATMRLHEEAKRRANASDWPQHQYWKKVAECVNRGESWHEAQRIAQCVTNYSGDDRWADPC